MKPKMTTAIATLMVEDIERLEMQIAEIYADADLNYTPPNNSRVIRDAIKARAALREAEFEAAGLLESFDVKDE